MSRARSSSVGSASALLLFSGATLLSGCSHASGPAGDSTAPGSGAVGYVRMDDLVKKHPLYPQLARFDSDISALGLKSIDPGITRSQADIAAQDAVLQKELDAAAAKTRTELKQKQDLYLKQENAAVLAAIGAKDAAAGAAIPGAMSATSASQVKAVASEAQKGFDAYRNQVSAQSAQEMQNLQQSLTARANRTYHARADELAAQESSYSLAQANADANARLSLRTRLQSLALDDAARADMKAQLDAIDRKEADGLAAMRNRDQATLAALQQQLQKQTQAEFQKEASGMRARAVARINERESDIRSHLVVQAQAAGGGINVASLPPSMRTTVEALHKRYQADYTKDAQSTIDAFLKTKGDLAKRYQAIHSADGGARADVQRQIDSLQKQRSELYDQMVEQIGRQVRIVAAQQGMRVVFRDIVAPAGGVDLTDAAEKEIESLHE